MRAQGDRLARSGHKAREGPAIRARWRSVESVTVSHYYSWQEPESVTPTSESFITIRPVGNDLEGGVYIIGDGLSVSGTFSIPNPWVGYP